MKKWYVITGILALLLLVSLGACSNKGLETELASVKTELTSTKDQLTESEAKLSSVETQLTGSEASLAWANTLLSRSETELASTKAELTKSKTELTSVNHDLTQAKAEITQLKLAQAISFGTGLKVFDVSISTYGAVSGKVQNTSNLSMKLVYVVVVGYDKDGTLIWVDEDSVSDLYPSEIGEWKTDSWWNKSPNTYAVYAFGNK